MSIGDGGGGGKPDADAQGTNAQWGGRFAAGPSAIMAEINASIGFDHALWRQDLRGSLAHARMLAETGIIAPDDEDAIRGGLEGIGAEIDAGTFPFERALEDIHMNIEARLTERVGEPGRRLHTARSRNDQVATDLRLWVRDAIDAVDAQIAALMLSLATRAAEHAGRACSMAGGRARSSEPQSQAPSDEAAAPRLRRLGLQRAAAGGPQRHPPGDARRRQPEGARRWHIRQGAGSGLRQQHAASRLRPAAVPPFMAPPGRRGLGQRPSEPGEAGRRKVACAASQQARSAAMHRAIAATTRRAQGTDRRGCGAQGRPIRPSQGWRAQAHSDRRGGCQA